MLTETAADPVPSSMGFVTPDCAVDVHDADGRRRRRRGRRDRRRRRAGASRSSPAISTTRRRPRPASTDGLVPHRRPGPPRRDGRFYFDGRRADVLKVAGENVSTVEVEQVLAAHPAVLEAAVVGQPDPVRDEVPVAFVVAADPGRPPTIDELHAVVRGAADQVEAARARSPSSTSCRAPAWARSASSCCAKRTRQVPARCHDAERVTDLTDRPAGSFDDRASSTSPRPRTHAAGDLHRRRVPRRSNGERCSITSGCASVVSAASPTSATTSPRTVNGEPIIVARGQGRGDPRLLGDLPAPRDAGRRRRRQLQQVHLPVPPCGSTASPAACSAPRRWNARPASTRRTFRCRRSRSSCGRASCSSTSTPMPRRWPDARPLRAVRRALRPRQRRVPRHVHAHRSAVELEGDVRELQRRLPRQQAAPHDPGLLPERAGGVPRAVGRRART